MRVRLPAAPVVILVAVVGGLAGCAKAATPPPVSLSPVPIADFASVAGRWEGLVAGLPPRRSSEDVDLIKVLIGPDGTYDFGIYRTIGVFGGKGQLALENGKLVLHGERGSATITLLEGDGQRVLRADGLMKNGVRVSSDLTPVR